MVKYLLNENEILKILNSVDFLIIINSDNNNFDFIPNINISNIPKIKNNLNDLFLVEKIFNENITNIMNIEKHKLVESKETPINKYNSFNIQNKFISIYYEKIDEIKNNIIKYMGLTKNSNPIDLLTKRM